MKKFYALLLMLCSVHISAHAQTIRYVKPVATGTGNGSSWANAADTLRGIINAASANTQIWVAAGTYKPTTGTDVTAAFSLKNGVQVIGGFPATGNPGLANRNMAANPTVLSGDIGSPATFTDNSLHVVFNANNGLNSTAVLDGFTITGGYYGDPANPDREAFNGAGIYTANASPTFINCIISGNNAAIFGGGVYNTGSSSTYINCAITGNTVYSTGPGMVSDNNSTITLRNCSFSKNTVTSAIGFEIALLNLRSSTTTATNCIFWNYSNSTFSPVITEFNDTTTTITYSLVQGGFPGIGNIDADPAFENDSANNLRLTPCSPCINAGSNAAVPPGATIDADGKPRIYNNSIVDMGAYESIVQNFPVGNPSEFGSNKWHVSVWRKADWDGYYAGYYTDTTFNFSTLDYWDSTASPSSAPGYQGCPTTSRIFSYKAKRIGFPCGYYQINNLRHSDSANLWVNDVLVWAQTGTNNAATANLWAGWLGPNDKVDYRVANTKGPSFGTLQFQPISSTTSTTNNALNFDGDKDFAVINSCNNAIFPGGDSLTVEYWFKGTNTQSAIRMEADTNYIISGWGNKKHILSNSGGTDGGVAIGDGFNDGKWHHIAFTWAQGGMFNSYLDGKIVHQTAASNNPLPIFNTGVYLGSLNGSSEFTQGSIEEMKIWTTVRMAQQIKASADSICNAVGNPYGLLIHYTFNQGNGGGNNANERVLVNQASSGILNAKLNSNNPGGFALTGNSSNWISFRLDSLVWYRDVDGDGFGSKTDSIFSCAKPAGYVRNNFDCNDNAVPHVIRMYVNSAATGLNNGTSWANAFTSLQSALVATCLDTLEIWVAKGTYKPSATMDAFKSFAVPFNAKLYGGFAGTETTLGQRSVANNPTILSGDLANNDVVTGAGATLSITGNGENSFTILSASSAVVDGFMLKGARNPNGFGGGGALVVDGDSLRVLNCTFTGNTRSVVATGGYVAFSNSIFKNNNSSSGSAVLLGGVIMKSVFSNCLFLDNQATGHGGAIAFVGNTTTNTFNGCTFSGNWSALRGGAVYTNSQLSAFSFSDCIFTNNTSNNLGGGALFSRTKRCEITNCSFTNNSFTMDTLGGAVFSYDSSLRIKNSIFWNNSSNQIYYEGPLTISNSIVQSGSFIGPTISTADPLFVNIANPVGSDNIWNTADDGLYLKPCSPARDAGSNIGASPTDITGQPRIYNNTVDLGAYESQSLPINNPPITTNNALNFDGVNDNVEIANCTATAPVLSGGNAITIEYWFKGSNIQSAVRFQSDGDYVVAGWNNTGNSANPFTHILSNDGGTPNGLPVGAAATDGLWHHVAMTWQRNTANGFKSYLDGQLIAQRASSNNPLPVLNTALNLGSYNSSAEFMSGSLDEVRIWKMVRTQNELKASMCGNLMDTTGLLYYYNFNHGAANGNNSNISNLTNQRTPGAFTGVLQGFNLAGISSNWVSGFNTCCQAGFITLTWTGTQSGDWQNPANWSGGIIPAACTDAVIPGATPFSPLITGTTGICHKITVNNGASVRVVTGAKLTVTGQ